MDRPEDDTFCEYFRSFLNQDDTPGIENYTPKNVTYIPVLDDAITPNEVHICMRQLEANKSAGVDGIPPGLLKSPRIHGWPHSRLFST